MYEAPISIRNHGKGHSYRDAKGVKVPGVTTIVKNGFPAKALINWAANTAAACVIDEWDRLQEMRPSTRYHYVRTAHNRDRDAAANRGTQIHKIAVPVAKGEDVPVEDILQSRVHGYIQFLDDWLVDPLFLELVVVNHKEGYAGRLDLIARLYNWRTGEWEVWLLDIKTSRSGVFTESVLQLAGYWGCEVMVIDGEYKDMPHIDRIGVVWVLENDYELIPVDVDEAAFAAFLVCKENAAFANDGERDGRERIGEALDKPPRHVEEDEGAETAGVTA